MSFSESRHDHFVVKYQLGRPHFRPQGQKWGLCFSTAHLPACRFGISLKAFLAIYYDYCYDYDYDYDYENKFLIDIPYYKF